MSELTAEQRAFLDRVKQNQERRSKYPQDMGFSAFSNKLAEGAELKAPWLQNYYSYRVSHPEENRNQLLHYLSQLPAGHSDREDRLRGSLIGLMIGDALGMPLEFKARDSKLVSDLESGGPFNLEAGDWTDDTSMACCLAYSLIKCQGFDAKHQMDCYSYWYRYGAFSSTGSCFDIGNTTRQAIERYLGDGNPFAGSTDPSTAGNGSLMRLAPVVLFYSDDFEKAVHFAAESSRITHQAVDAVDACRYYAALIHGAVHGVNKSVLLNGLYSPNPGYWQKSPLAPAVQAVAMGSYKKKPRDQISSSGYVVDTLEAALWSFYRNEDFRKGALEAVNLGNDADTVGAVYGQLAGAYFGETQLPIDWIVRTHASHGCYHFAQDMMMVTVGRNRP